MEWDNVIYTMVFLLVGMNAIMFYMENYITDEQGHPFISGAYSPGIFNYTDVNSNIGSLQTTSNQATISDTKNPTLVEFVASSLASFQKLLSYMFNLATGYTRLLNFILAPLGVVGQALTYLFISIISIPVFIGIIFVIRWIMQIVNFVRWV